MTFFAEIAGQRLTAIKLHVPQRGAWFATCDFEAAPTLPEGIQTLTLGALALRGTIASGYDGSFGERRKCLVVGGAGGWRKSVVPRAYHNDAGVKAQLVAQDLAREIGESLGDFVPGAERLGADYVRDSSMPASQVLEDVIGEVLWWVAPDGVTRVGQRLAPGALAADSYKVLSYDPRARLAELSLDDPSVLAIGHALTGPALPQAQTVREYTVQADAAGVRVTAWCGGGSRSAGRLAGLLSQVASRVTERPLLGLYRYRVVSQAGDGRVSLQAVRKASGLPDITSIAQWPGLPGTLPELAPGSEVLVQFVEGDRAQPIVTHYPADGSGNPVARQGDTVEVLLPPAVFTGTVGGAPATGTVLWPANALGSITTGSGKAKLS